MINIFYHPEKIRSSIKASILYVRNVDPFSSLSFLIEAPVPNGTLDETLGEGCTMVELRLK